jgi:hypothetical protein
MNIRSAATRRPLIGALLIALMLPLIVACGGGDDGADAAGTAAAEAAGGASSALLTMDGRAVSATDEEVVLETASGQWTFKIRPEDLAAVDVEHIDSHVGVPDEAFRVFYVTQDGVDYAVSVEHIDASTLGF